MTRFGLAVSELLKMTRKPLLAYPQPRPHAPAVALCLASRSIGRAAAMFFLNIRTGEPQLSPFTPAKR
jgi:hypothetical protein